MNDLAIPITYLYSYEPASFFYCVDGTLENTCSSNATVQPKQPSEIANKQFPVKKKRFLSEMSSNMEGEDQAKAEEFEGGNFPSSKRSKFEEDSKAKELACNAEKPKEESANDFYEVFRLATDSFESSSLGISCNFPFYAEWKENMVNL